MKNIQLIVISIVMTLSVKAQNLCPYPNGTYATKPELNQFVGTWKSISGTDTVTIVFQKQKVHFQDDLCTYDSDEMLGWHKYVKNGVVIENNLQYVGQPYDNETESLGDLTRTNNEMWLGFWDPTLEKACHVTFKMVSGSTTQATWLLKDCIPYISGTPYCTLPQNLVFTKQ